MSGDRCIPVSVCTGVYYENFTSARLLCCLVLPLTQQILHLNKKTTQKLKYRKLYLCQNAQESLETSFCLSLTHRSTYSSRIRTTKKVVHPLETKDLTHTRVDTLSNTHTRAPRSAVIHLSLIPTCQPAPPTVSAPRKVTAFQ